MSPETQSTQDAKASERLVAFIQKYRTLVVSLSVAVVAAVAVAGGAFAFIEASEKKAVAAVEELIARYDELRAQTDDAAKTEKLDALLADAERMGKGKGFAAARSLMLAASVYADKKEWSGAEKQWLAAVEAAPTAYTAPLSVYNAATAAEERGDTKKALELYARCAETYKDSFALASRALFAVGRLNEELKDFAASAAAYKKVVEQWPNDDWTKLAHSRILGIAAKEGSK